MWHLQNSGAEARIFFTLVPISPVVVGMPAVLQVRHVEDIPFERIRQQKATSQEKKITDMQHVLASADKHTIVGRWVRDGVVWGRSCAGSLAGVQIESEAGWRKGMLCHWRLGRGLLECTVCLGKL